MVLFNLTQLTYNSIKSIQLINQYSTKITITWLLRHLILYNQKRLSSGVAGQGSGLPEVGRMTCVNSANSKRKFWCCPLPLLHSVPFSTAVSITTRFALQSRNCNCRYVFTVLLDGRGGQNRFLVQTSSRLYQLPKIWLQSAGNAESGD